MALGIFKIFDGNKWVEISTNVVVDDNGLYLDNQKVVFPNTDNNNNLTGINFGNINYEIPSVELEFCENSDEDATELKQIIINGDKWKIASGGSNIVVDSSMNESSENPLQNKVISKAITNINNRLNNLTRLVYMGIVDRVDGTGINASMVDDSEIVQVHRYLPTQSQIEIGGLDSSSWFIPSKGQYWVVNVITTFDGLDLNVGDWLIYNGASWGKVDNTDNVNSVAGLKGTISTEDLQEELGIGDIEAILDEINNGSVADIEAALTADY